MRNSSTHGNINERNSTEIQYIYTRCFRVADRRRLQDAAPTPPPAPSLASTVTRAVSQDAEFVARLRRRQRKALVFCCKPPSGPSSAAFPNSVHALHPTQPTTSRRPSSPDTTVDPSERYAPAAARSTWPTYALFSSFFISITAASSSSSCIVVTHSSRWAPRALRLVHSRGHSRH